MKQNVLILFALCLISLLFTGCSQNNVVHEDHISSDVLDLNSSEIVSSESEESESSSEDTINLKQALRAPRLKIINKS